LGGGEIEEVLGRIHGGRLNVINRRKRWNKKKTKEERPKLYLKKVEVGYT